MPTQPLASTRACAVVGVEGIIRPIKDLLRASDFDRGVADEGNGTGTETGLEVRVMAEGVRAERVGEGGKTKRVWEGVCKTGL